MAERARVIVLGNEKGGSGKSTTAMHLFAALARQGLKVGVIDLDTRQLSFRRYVENRQKFSEDRNLRLLMPMVREINLSDLRDRDKAADEESTQFSNAIQELAAHCDVILIDCPGNYSHLSRLGHAAADILITPMNDSFIDFDLLARIDPTTQEIIGPSIYSELVWESRKLRAEAGLKPLDWIVIRNRLSAQNANNKRRVGDMLEKLSKRIGFRIAPGLSERVVYRELFLSGLTLLDLKEPGAKVPLTMSHVAARQELRDLIHALQLDFLSAEESDEEALSESA